MDIILAKGEQLTITANATSSGYVSQKALIVGDIDQNYTTIAISTTTTFGPYAQLERFSIVSNVGALTHSKASVDFPTAAENAAAAATPLLTHLGNHIFTAVDTDGQWITGIEGYDAYELVCPRLVFSETGKSLDATVSPDGGVTERTGAAAYSWRYEGVRTVSTTETHISDISDAHMQLIPDWTGFDRYKVDMELIGFTDAGDQTGVSSECTGGDTALTGLNLTRNLGRYDTALEVHNALKLAPSSGTITGTFMLFGVGVAL